MLHLWLLHWLPYIMTVPLQQPSARRELLALRASLQIHHCHARTLVPQSTWFWYQLWSTPYVHRENSLEKCTISADILLMFSMETLVPFGGLEHPNLCETVCYDNEIIDFCITPIHFHTQRHFEMHWFIHHAAQLGSQQFCRVMLSLYNCCWWSTVPIHISIS